MLTAAHCTVGRSAENISVVMGHHDVDSDDVMIVSVIKITEDPLYNPDNYHANDFSILTLSSPVIFTDQAGEHFILCRQVNDLFSQLRPACLPRDAADYSGEAASVSGWGTLGEGISAGKPSSLHAVNVTVWSNSKCNEAYTSSKISR